MVSAHPCRYHVDEAVYVWLRIPLIVYAVPIDREQSELSDAGCLFGSAAVKWYRRSPEGQPASSWLTATVARGLDAGVQTARARQHLVPHSAETVNRPRNGRG